MTPDLITLFGVVRLINPLTRKNSRVASRIAVLKDGRTVPVLRLFAAHLKGGSVPQDAVPYWLDGDYENEELSNVGFATKPKASPFKKKSPYSAPSGTLEYMREWRAANRERVRAAQKRFAARKTEEAASAAEPDILRTLEKLVGEK